MIKKIKAFLGSFIFLIMLPFPLKAAGHITYIHYHYYSPSWLLADYYDLLDSSELALGTAAKFYDLVNERLELGMTQIEAVESASNYWLQNEDSLDIEPLEFDFINFMEDLNTNRVKVMGLSENITAINEGGLEFPTLHLTYTVFDPDLNASLAFSLANGNFNSESNHVFYNYDDTDYLPLFLEIADSRPATGVFLDYEINTKEELKKALANIGVEYKEITTP